MMLTLLTSTIGAKGIPIKGNNGTFTAISGTKDGVIASFCCTVAYNVAP